MENPASWGVTTAVLCHAPAGQAENFQPGAQKTPHSFIKFTLVFCKHSVSIQKHFLIRNTFLTSSAQQFLAHSLPLGLQHLYAEGEVNTFLKVTIATLITSLCNSAQRGTARAGRCTHPWAGGGGAAQHTDRLLPASGQLPQISSRDADFNYF